MVVVARIERKTGTLLLVAPVTHTPPSPGDAAIEIPARVKKQLGLDEAQSWVVVNELNRFVWPGPDVRLVPGSGTPFYDALPDWLFERVRQGVLDHNAANKLRVTKRTT